jgi:two-component system phosphate regulon sensor histidine kinase PhoR
MNKRFIATVISLATIGLMGIIFIQLFWFQKAIKLQKDQFDNQSQIALKGVVNQLFKERQPINDSDNDCAAFCDLGSSEALKKINVVLLDSLLSNEFRDLRITSPFQFGVYQTVSKHFVLKGKGFNEENVVKSKHKIALTCMHKSDAYILSVYFINEKEIIKGRLSPLMLLSLLLIIGLAGLFGYVVYILNKQKRLGEMKSDFVNNMTHEFKTPISTISLASEMLLKSEVYSDSNRVGKYAKMIYDENSRLRSMVEWVLQMAVLDKGEYRLKMRETDAHQIIRELIQRFTLAVKPHGGNICLNLKATCYTFKVDKIHFINIISNLLDNAIKYSPEKLHITLKTWSDDKGFYIMVEDKGMGISQEHQRHIFRNLYRVPTGNLHNVKGFGLGLYYVKTLMAAHGGSVKVTSELRKGSKFELFFPFIHQNNMIDEQDSEESQPAVGRG